MLWDIEALSSSGGSDRGHGSGGLAPRWACRKAHEGHVTALTWADGMASAAPVGEGGSSGGLLSGGQDGYVRAWDARAPPGVACVAERALHVTPKGRGAVTAVLAGGGKVAIRGTPPWC
jgi:hypothetical protein